MTCIVGLVQDNKIYMGGDRAAANDSEIYLIKEPKVFINEGFLIGYTTSFRMGYLLQYNYSPPIRNKKEPLEGFMRTTFIDSIINLFKRNDFGGKSEDGSKGGIFLVGIEKRLFNIQEDFSVMESDNDYYSIGSGADYALGALHVIPYEPPIRRIEKAISAAVRHCTTVRGKVDILHI